MPRPTIRRLERVMGPPAPPASWLVRLGGSPRPVRHIHCIGVCGSGMAGLAGLLLEQGITVSGSDASDTPGVEDLTRRGLLFYLGQRAENVHADVDLVVHSAAVLPSNPERTQAARLGVPDFKYATFLGSLMAQRRGIAVAGTHGKTTTTGMLAWILRRTGADPSYVVGGRLPALGGSSHFGQGPDFIAEACEFDRSFLSLSYRTAIVTNVEPDHLDYYRDLDEIVEAFRAFAAATAPDGIVIWRADDPEARRVVAGIEIRTEPFALAGTATDAIWTALPLDGPGNRFRLFRHGHPVAEGVLAVPGRHNILDATAAIAGAAAAHIDPAAAADALADFPGVDRRFQVLHETPDLAIVDDYAHHPTEIRAVLDAARTRFRGRRLCVVFQPHQHSRLRRFLPGFGEALALADRVIVSDVYVARDPEEERRSVTSGDLVLGIRAHGTEVAFAPTFAGAVEAVRRAHRSGDVVITMGAGDIDRVARLLLDETAPPRVRRTA